MIGQTIVELKRSHERPGLSNLTMKKNSMKMPVNYERCVVAVVLLLTFLKTLPCEATENSEATLVFGGDVCLGDVVGYFADKTCDHKRPFQRIKPYLEDADLTIVNLETVLWTDRTPPPNEYLPEKIITHWSKAKSVEGLKYAGIDIVSLANNHVLDYGEKGINSTIKLLKKSGIEHIGLTEAGQKTQNPIIKTIKGIKIGFLAYCYIADGCLYGHDFVPIKQAWYNKKVISSEIQQLRKKVDYLVVIMHWGYEYIPVPPSRVRIVAMELKILGVNLTIGSHPHVPQNYKCVGENYFVAYSLGNLLFLRHGVDNPEGSESKFNVSKYAKQMREISNPTQFSFLLKFKINRKEILEASYLQYEIKDEPKTHCLQPTPLTGKWEKVCGKSDLKCYDLAAMSIASDDALREHSVRKTYQCLPN
eukprot:gene8769-9706_t